jgi:hypothetical protein
MRNISVDKKGEMMFRRESRINGRDLRGAVTGQNNKISLGKCGGEKFRAGDHRERSSFTIFPSGPNPQGYLVQHSTNQSR